MDRPENKIDDQGRDKRDPPAWRQFLSHDSGPFAQFVKYGAIGVASTLVHPELFLSPQSCETLKTCA